MACFATAEAVLLFRSTERTAPPKEASVTKTDDVPGTFAEPKRTAVPAGELLISVVAREAVFFQGWLSTGKTEKKPVLLTAGLPFTVAKRRDSSSEKNTCETVFVGPTGGVVWMRPNDRKSSIAPSPCLEKLEQDTPLLAPVVPTHASWCFADAATVFGNSPGSEAAWPTMVSLVGSRGSMDIIDRVLLPALTAKRF